MRIQGIAAALALSGFAAFPAMSQTFTTIDISKKANFTWTGQETDPTGPSGIYFPGGPSGQVTLGGIPFNIRSNKQGFQAWNAYTASGGSGSKPENLKITTSIAGATTVYALINTSWGLGGTMSDSKLIFTDAAGDIFRKALKANTDIRGWCCTGSINGTTTVNVYSEANSFLNLGPGYLDMQKIVLPRKFAKSTLTMITLSDHGASNVQRTILDGLTVQIAPR
jgi:hypothetical protein